MRKRVWGVTALVLFIAFGCQKPELSEVQPTERENAARMEVVDAEQARTLFAQTLAKALVKKELRDFIRTEALKKFDLDYDVLYHVHKNRKIAGDQTLQALLASYYSGTASFESITRSLPKLTIFVPDFILISAEKWDTQTLIPKVVASQPEKNNVSEKFLTAYDHQGKSITVDAVSIPNELILVVKDNDRVEVTGKYSASTAGKYAQLFQTDGENQYYFTHPNFDGTKGRMNSLGGAATNGWEDVIKILWPELEAESMNPNRQREWLYYNTTGILNGNAMERINHFRFVNDEAVRIATDGWAEGNLELNIIVLLGGQTPTAFQNNLIGVWGMDVMAARLSIPNFIETFVAPYPTSPINMKEALRKDLLAKQADYKARGILFQQSITYSAAADGTDANTWWLAVNTDGINWSPNRYGDVVKYVFMEKDNGEIVKTTRSYDVGFNASIGKKDSWNIGLNTRVAGSTEVTYTNNSDQLGEQFCYWDNKVGVTRKPHAAGGIEFRVQTLTR